MKTLAWAPGKHSATSACEKHRTWDLLPSLVPGQDLDTMEESSEIKVEPSVSRTSRIQSYLAAGGKTISNALSYITGEMKECGEGLKGKGSVGATPDPTLKGHPQSSPRKHFAVVLYRLD